jgi:uncharacterized protein YndB with AHSA1/START domain
MTASTEAAHARQFVIDRTLKAPMEKVWKMWTTKEGLEKWWGPHGFSCVVTHLDVRVGGRFEIVMTAMLPAIIAQLKASGVGATSVAKGDYTAVEVNRRLAYTNGIDFVPDIAPYMTNTIVDMNALPGGGTRLIVSNDAMHDEQWTLMATMGWTQQIGKLEKLMG